MTTLSSSAGFEMRVWNDHGVKGVFPSIWLTTLTKVQGSHKYVSLTMAGTHPIQSYFTEADHDANAGHAAMILDPMYVSSRAEVRVEVVGIEACTS